jgi:hypothetical protein
MWGIFFGCSHFKPSTYKGDWEVIFVKHAHDGDLKHALITVIKAIRNNEERKKNHSTETQDFNVENPLQQRDVKNHGRQPAKLHYILSVYKTPWITDGAVMNGARKLVGV